MDYEKKYKEALEKARQLCAYPTTKPFISDLQDLFPELKESEDERIRKELTDYIKSKFENSCSPTPSKNILGNWIAWLEKQGEHKSVDKVESKFKEGDWIIFNGLILYIKEVVQGYYRTISINNIPNSYDWDIDNAARLWTIKEAKNGDVLKEDSCVFIVERINPNGTARVHCCLFDDGEFDLTGSTLGFDIDSTYPATKEQRDFLFQKIKEANHKWDADVKVLIKL